MDKKTFCHSVRETYVKLFIYICWTLKKYIDTVYKYKLASERYFQCVHNVWDFISIKNWESQFETCIKNLKVCALKYTCTSSRRKNFIRGNHGEYLVPPLLWLCSSSGKLKFSKIYINFVSSSSWQITPIGIETLVNTFSATIYYFCRLYSPPFSRYLRHINNVVTAWFLKIFSSGCIVHVVHKS